MGLFSKKPSLKDETVKKYYEMIYGMRTYLAWSGNESADKDSRARKYVEFMLGGPCDEAKLKDAVELINMSRVEYPKTKLENELKEFNKLLKPLRKYECNKTTAYKLCYPELLAEVKSAYEMVLDVVKENCDCKIFCQGINTQIFEKIKADNIMLYNCIQIVMVDSFFEGNPITSKLLFSLLTDILGNRANKRIEYDNEKYANIVNAIVLRAVNFEKYGKNRDEYTSITEEGCKKFVAKSEFYSDILAKRPFEKDAYTEKYANEIKKATIFNTLCSSYYNKYTNNMEWLWIDGRNDYAIDAICNYVWKEIGKEYENGDSKDPVIMFNMLWDYTKE